VGTLSSYNCGLPKGGGKNKSHYSYSFLVVIDDEKLSLRKRLVR